MKNPALIIIVLCLVGITAPLIHAAENAYVHCGSEPDSPKQVPVFTAPGSAWAVAQLPCGQPVTLLSLDRGYAKIQSGNQVGYVVSVFILKQETQEDLKARIDQLESEVRTLKSQQGQTAETGRPLSTANQPGRTVPPGPVSKRDFPLAEIGGMFSYVRTFESDFGANWYGWNASVAGNLTRTFGIEGNIGGNYLNTGTNLVGSSVYTVLGGPRFAFRSPTVTPFVHFLVGLAHLRGEFLFFGASTNGFALVPGGGLDVNLNRRLAVRAFQFDYIAIRALDAWSYRNVRIGGGLVVKF